MPDEKTIRRRRAVFLLLLVATFVLLTGSFVGAFGGAERGFSGIVSPIQEGASKVAKPGRDLVNWVGDTFRAKKDLAKVRAERDQLQEENAQLYSVARRSLKETQLTELMARLSLDNFGPVEATLIAQTTSAWERSITISKGSSDGIAVRDPVVGPDGLVGVVSRVMRGQSIVRLVTDPKSGVKARIDNVDETGTLSAAKVGGAGDLVLDVPKNSNIKRGNLVVTSGTTSAEFPSLFPPDVPVGKVSNVQDAGQDSQVVQVQAIADMRRLETLRVLTDVRAGL